MKLSVDHTTTFHNICQRCHQPLGKQSLFFQGIHTCLQSYCQHCQQTVITDLPTGHGRDYPYQIHWEKQQLFGSAITRDWLGEPFIDSLLHPSTVDIKLRVEKKFTTKKVVLLNCLDYLYGHALLKLFNASSHLKKKQSLIVLCQKNLRWLVPKQVAEVWTVDIPFSQTQSYYPSLRHQVEKELTRFQVVKLSPAYSHPKFPDIQLHTGFSAHDFNSANFRITFIVRDDRLWVNQPIPKKLKVIRELQRQWQYLKIWWLFHSLYQLLPKAEYTIAGMGTPVKWLPAWIKQSIHSQIDEKIEKDLCKIYTESRVVVGIHGSNMLLPSALAGASVDLMPADRWGNFAQDVVYRPNEDPRMSSFYRRFLPVNIGISTLTKIIFSLISDYQAINNNYSME